MVTLKTPSPDGQDERGNVCRKCEADQNQTDDDTVPPEIQGRRLMLKSELVLEQLEKGLWGLLRAARVNLMFVLTFLFR